MAFTEREIWACATLYLQRHGPFAKLEAGKRADELLAARDFAGQAMWIRICRAIDELQRRQRRSDERLN